MGDLFALVALLGQTIRPMRKRVMTADGRTMKASRMATSEKRMLGARWKPTISNTVCTYMSVILYVHHNVDMLSKTLW